MGGLLVMRHGPAEEARWGIPDEARALTEAGRDVVIRALRALGAWRPTHIFTSPYRRARQTAELLQVGFGEPPVPIEPWEALAPTGDPDRVILELEAHGIASDWKAQWVLVGHLPLVGDLVERLTHRRVAFPTAGWAWIQVEDDGRFHLSRTSEHRP